VRPCKTNVRAIVVKTKVVDEPFRGKNLLILLLLGGRSLTSNEVKSLYSYSILHFKNGE
jgi:hypothetical protein